MKWIEVKWLCTGMCVCTVLAAGRAAVEKNLEQRQVPILTETIAAEVSETEISEMEISETETETLDTMASDIGMPDAAGTEMDELPQAEAEQHEIHRNGFGSGTEDIEESNLIIADVTNYVNIRSIPSEEGEILGKLYDNSVGRRYGEENGWYYIESGRVKGYVKAEFVLIGEAARLRAQEVGTRLAEVTTTTLKVRKEADIQSKILGLVPGGDILNVLEEMEGWIKVDTEEGLGYVSADYVNVYTENVEAESKEEEEIRLKKEEARKKAEAAAKEALKKQQQANKPSDKPVSNTQSALETGSSTDENSYYIGSNSAAGNSGNAENNVNTETGENTDLEGSSTEIGRKIADYAMQFVGNPYVYGGTSLTDGADCSGFVQSVYKHFGISLPRTSGEQGKAGYAVDGIANAKPGDLIWYSGHIGIYIGNGKIVHASSPKNGIMISEATYRTILGIRRIV